MLAIVLALVAALAVVLPRIKNASSASSGQTNMGSLEDSPESIGQDERNQLLNAAVGDYVTFGSYEQDNNLDNGKEDIEWLVLEKENRRLLVISKYALDCQPYNTTKAGVTWETCSLRKWMNETFLTEAFSTEERSMIPSVPTSADQNPEYNTDSGNSTEDNIFLLSIVEANEYFISNEKRRCAPTEYAMVQGAHTNENDKVNDRAACRWWLRSPGLYSYYAAFVSSAGSALSGGSDVYSNTFAVRPALWISLEEEQSEDETGIDSDAGSDTDISSNSDEQASRGSREESPETIRQDERNQLLNAEVGDYVTFGSYEQDNNLDNGKEDIEWLVLAKENNRLFVISRYGLDCQPYNNELTAVTWETCSLRVWLNETFTNDAFSNGEKAVILTVTVNADKNPDNDTDPGNSTADRVFLLSVPELTQYLRVKEARMCIPTDYAIAQGAIPTDDDYKVDGKATCLWWLRSPGRDYDLAAYVGYGGGIHDFGDVDRDYYEIRPALWIDLDLES